MNYKRVLTVQDISCVGQCSLTVALPILSAAGHETCILPSAVLSTHTGGFSGYTVRDLTDDLPAIAAHWRKEGILFDAIYTGYLGSAAQIQQVQELFRTCAAEGCVKVVDPVMADNGKLYHGFDAAYVEQMKPLIAAAEIILPNITEASFLTGLPYREQYDAAYVAALVEGLRAAGARTVLLTGVSFEADTTGVLIAEGEKQQYYRHKRLPGGCHGTGDIFASAFVGAYLRGKTACAAAQIAADYVLRCIELTRADPKHWYGAKFEPMLPTYLQALQAQEQAE